MQIVKGNTMKVLLVITGIIGTVLGYGYWHLTTHAVFHVILNVNRGVESKLISTPEIKIQFIDAKGAVLAKGINDKNYNYIHLIDPVHGDCREVEKKAPFSREARNSWQECFENQSIWISKWIRDVQKVNLEYGKCLQQDIPIAVSYNSDWYLWWVPHPHIGGKPFSYYNSTIKIDEQDCV